MTNGGAQHQDFENALSDFLDVPHCIAFANGTLALNAALSLFDLKGEVITTPFSFVATAHVLKPLGLTPRFVDIEPEGLGLDPVAVEAAITEETSAIFPVHVYGNPCQVEALEKISCQNNLKLIYDAAHCFGVRYKGKSLLSYGDASALSFHATKSFHTFEGGAVIAPDADQATWLQRYKNFGLDAQGAADFEGINGKMNELQAAIGLLNLQMHSEVIHKRKVLYLRYLEQLEDIEGLQFIRPPAGTEPNYAYCPLRIGRSFPLNRDALMAKLEEHNIFARRYFYPLITDMPAYCDYKQHFPVATQIAEEILCLPLYPDLSEEDQSRVIDVIASSL